MKYIPPKFERFAEMSAIDICRLTEDEARAILEHIRWPEGVKCAHCGSDNVTRLNSKSEKVRDGLIQCNACRKQFTVMIGTVMEDSHITLRQWVQAFHSMSSHKKGISALQLQRNLGLGSYKSAWHLAHRIRLAMKEGALAAALKGTVEVDETYIGGKPRKGSGKRGRGTKKAPVMAMVERGGRIITKPVKNVTAKTLKSAIREAVDSESKIITDEFRSYIGIGKDFKGGHGVVNHGLGQYVNGDISTNTAESFFALVKRGVNSTFHHISKKHLGRYCNEFSFRWDNRKVTDGERAEEAVKGMEGERLMLKNLLKGNSEPCFVR
ncbi:MAG: IS1595 family transposase [Smithellaceae bacterium]|jgi:transposase-like protein